MARADIEAGRSYVSLYVKNNAFLRGMDAAGKKLQGFGKGVATIGAGITAAGSAILAPLGAAVTQFMKVGDELDKMSGRTGASAQALAELGYAARQSGSSANDVENGMRKLSKVLIDAERGGKAAQDTLGALGMSLEDLQGLSPDEQFTKLAGAIAEVEDPMRKAALAQELFGKSGTKLLPLINSGVEGINALREQARGLGINVSDEDVKNAVVLGDTWADVGESVQAAIFQIGAALAPTLIKVAETIRTVVSAVTKWVTENRKLFLGIAAAGAALVGFGAAMTGIGGVIALVGAALSGAATVLGAIGVAISAVLSPVGLLTIALTAGVYAWARYTESGQATVATITTALGKLWAVAKDTFGGISNALTAGNLPLAGEIAMTGLQLAFVEGMNALTASITGSMGDLVGTLIAQIGGGDLSGAWNTVVLQMSAVWFEFTEGIVAAFTNAARSVVEVWRNTVNAITDQILEMASQGGVVGAALSKILGVDLKAEQERANRLNAELGLAPEDVTANAQAEARARNSEIADSMTAKLDEIDRNANARATASRAAADRSIAGGRSAAQAQADLLRATLDRLRGEAATAAAEARERMAAPSPDTSGARDIGRVMGFSSSSAVVAAAGGFAKTAQDRIAKGVEDQLKVAKELLRNGERLLDEVRAAGAVT